MYGIIAGPGLFVAAVVLLIGTKGRDEGVWLALIIATVCTTFGWFAFGLRGQRVRQQARKLLALYHSPVDPLGRGSLVWLIQRSILHEPSREGAE